MRGSLHRRSAGSWSLVLDLGFVIDPRTGRRKRQQKWVTFTGTKKQAETRLNELVRAAQRGEFVDTDKRTVAEWFTEWLEKAIKPPATRASTHRIYTHVLTHHVLPVLGSIPLQALKAADVKRYYLEAGTTLSASTLAQHHAIISGALKAAVLEGLVTRNVAALVVGKPQPAERHDDVIRHCWEPDEARAFLAAAKTFGPQPAAFYGLALDTGARKNELCGLCWSDLDLEAGTVRVVRQLTRTGPEPEFGPVKNGIPRTIDLAPDTVTLLREHKRAQAELKMRNRTVYRDLGLVFAREWSDLHGCEASLGLPLQSNNLGEREFARVLAAGAIRRIKFHGLRHTSATLLLKAHVPVHVVSRRLGHKKVQTTLEIYAHALPSMQQEAARTIGAILHG